MRLRILFRLLLSFSLAALLTPAAARAQGRPTTIYLVRHAEKELTPGLADPPLTPAGEQRAQALRAALQKRKVAAIFTTNTIRTRATAAPLAAALKLTPLVYEAKTPADLAALATRIRTEYAGRTVLVVGHSNTILETAEALGAARPVPTVADSEFDYLLEVKLPAAGTPTVVARHYGAGLAR